MIGLVPTGVSPIAHAVRSTLTFVGECILLTWESIKRAPRKPFEVGETLNQMAFMGVSSVPIVVLTTFSSGAVLALYTSDVLARYGAAGLVGAAVGLSVTREIAPVLAGIMVAARAGSAMAAQIGSMNVTEQVDALRSLSVHPVNYLVIPRLVAGILMLPVLALTGMYSGILGGYLIGIASADVPSGAFVDSIQQFVEMRDVVGGMAKTIVFGAIVSLVACQQGLRTRGGAVGVGKATTRTVVLTMVLIYVANFFLTWMIFK